MFKIQRGSKDIVKIAHVTSVNRVSSVAVYAGSETSQISSKTFEYVFQRWTKVLWVWNDMKVSN